MNPNAVAPASKAKPKSKRKKADDDDDDDGKPAKKPRSAAAKKPASKGKQKKVEDDEEDAGEDDDDEGVDNGKANVEVLLATKWDLEKGTDPTGWWVSEKLDGVRFVLLGVRQLHSLLMIFFL